MQMKIKEKMIAVVMAFAMMFTFIFAGESSEVIAAAKTKALEINVDFARNAASGDDSGIYNIYASQSCMNAILYNISFCILCGKAHVPCPEILIRKICYKKSTVY